jgi:hypothetical protein
LRYTFFINKFSDRAATIRQEGGTKKEPAGKKRDLRFLILKKNVSIIKNQS